MIEIDEDPLCSIMRNRIVAGTGREADVVAVKRSVIEEREDRGADVEPSIGHYNFSSRFS